MEVVSIWSRLIVNFVRREETTKKRCTPHMIVMNHIPYCVFISPDGAGQCSLTAVCGTCFRYCETDVISLHAIATQSLFID